MRLHQGEALEMPIMTKTFVLRGGFCAILGALAACNDSSNSATGSSTSATANASTVALSAAHYSAAVSSNLEMNINRNGSSNGAVTVNYASVNGTATAGLDYRPVSGTLTWADGDISSRIITAP